MGVKNQKKCSYNSSILAGKIDQEGKMLIILALKLTKAKLAEVLCFQPRMQR